MPKIEALTGNDAVAYAMRQINPDVVAAYPITPQTSLMEKFADFIADGDIDTELVLVESEHSAMSATIGASSAGARAMTATSSQGFALMWEMVYIAAGLRLPIVMPLVNRALSAPINIHCDHSDAMGGRDSGWIQLWSENAQEAYENTIQAVRIAEHPDVLLPVLVNLDGFIISHGMENVAIHEDEKVRKFVGEYRPKYRLLDAKNPITVGLLDLPDYYFEHRRQMAEGMKNAYGVIGQVAAEFKKEFGPAYGFVAPYRMEDAEFAIVGLGSTMGTLRVVIDEYRKKGLRVGALKIRVFRPFPQDDIVKAVKGLKAAAVLDRSDSLNGMSGPLYGDMRCALYGNASVPCVDYIYGLGGRDVTLDDLRGIVEDLVRISKTGKIERELKYLGVRE
jgi:pyruvate ferredoxin oxidoreductase alpha subunit